MEDVGGKEWLESYGNAHWAKARTGVSNSLTVSARTGAQEMVAALRWLTENGYEPATRSEIVGLCVKVVASQLGPALWPEIEEAHTFLDTHFGVATKSRGKMIRTARIRNPEVRAQSYAAFREESQPSPVATAVEKDGAYYFVCSTDEDCHSFAQAKADIISATGAKVVSTAEAKKLGVI